MVPNYNQSYSFDQEVLVGGITAVDPVSPSSSDVSTQSVGFLSPALAPLPLKAVSLQFQGKSIPNRLPEQGSRSTSPDTTPREEKRMHPQRSRNKSKSTCISPSNTVRMKQSVSISPLPKPMDAGQVFYESQESHDSFDKHTSAVVSRSKLPNPHEQSMQNIGLTETRSHGQSQPLQTGVEVVCTICEGLTKPIPMNAATPQICMGFDVSLLSHDLALLQHCLTCPHNTNENSRHAVLEEYNTPLIQTFLADSAVHSQIQEFGDLALSPLENILLGFQNLAQKPVLSRHVLTTNLPLPTIPSFHLPQQPGHPKGPKRPSPRVRNAKIITPYEAADASMTLQEEFNSSKNCLVNVDTSALLNNTSIHVDYVESVTSYE